MTEEIDRASHIGGTSDFNVVFVGAGNIMFGEPMGLLRSDGLELTHTCYVLVAAGSPEGPWNHSFRFEQYALHRAFSRVLHP